MKDYLFEVKGTGEKYLFQQVHLLKHMKLYSIMAFITANVNLLTYLVVARRIY